MRLQKKLMLLLCLGCFYFSLPAEARQRLSKQYEKERKEWVDSVIKTLSPREQAAQLMVKACFPALGAEHIGKVAKFVEEDGIGGITMSRGGPVLHIQTVNKLQALSKVPLMIFMDAEWGVAMRLDSVVSFPRQMTLGAIVNNDLIYAMGEEVAMQFKRLGMHMNYAPAVDINNNPNNPVIGFRAFGEDKYNVSQKAVQYMKGMQDNGIMTCAKHFPGHGDTDVDSHAALPLISHDKKRLEDIELYPFREQIKAGVDGIMVAHLNIPAYEKKAGIPSSMSREIVYKLLRKKMKYDGIVLTDGLEMKGVTDHYPANQLPLIAFQAGNDISVGVENPTGALDEFEKAIKSGKISKKAIEKACRTVLEAKYDAGLSRYRAIDTTGAVYDLNSPRAAALNNRLYENAITLVKNAAALPLTGDKLQKAAYLEVGDGTYFAEKLSSYGELKRVSIAAKPTASAADSVKALLEPFDMVIVGYHSTNYRPKFSYGVDSTNVELIASLAARKKVVLDFFGVPYGLSTFKNIEALAAILVSYDNTPESQVQSARILMGEVKPVGKLPVSIGDTYKHGFGISW